MKWDNPEEAIRFNITTKSGRSIYLFGRDSEHVRIRYETEYRRNNDGNFNIKECNE